MTALAATETAFQDFALGRADAKERITALEKKI